MSVGLTMMHQIINNISEGIICIDKDKRISLINDRAKEIFGISSDYEIGHEAGQLEEGDIVIFGDNSLGFDDGGLTGEDLKRLGVNEFIQDKSAIVFIGIYGGETYYQSSNNYNSTPLVLSKRLMDKNITVAIDFIQRLIDISVDGRSIKYSYIKGVGHAVIISGSTGELKFYQSKGYTVRGEELRAVLHQKYYKEKISGRTSDFDVLGERIDEILENSESIKKLIDSAEGKQVNYLNKYDEINRRPIRCSVYPLSNNDGKLEGASLKFEDMSDLKTMMEERDNILEKLQEIEDFEREAFNTLIGESAEIKNVKTYSRKAALSSANILILGESGTGKSILAKMIHDYSNRKNEEFVEINCGALSENLLESELFGYVPGAFTGANPKGKLGLIEYASGGTLFLDEISEMPSSLQVKLLHFIQNRWIIPVGGTKIKEVDVRLICATNRDLTALINTGSFREDLYYRINVIPIALPPLRAHKEDLHYLIISIIHKICKKEGLSIKTMSNEAFNKLFSYDFPGNVRELENIIERAINICEGRFINEEDITIADSKQIPEMSKPLKLLLEDAEKRAIASSLKRFNGDKVKVMKALDIKKTSLYDKIKKYNLE